MKGYSGGSDKVISLRHYVLLKQPFYKCSHLIYRPKTSILHGEMMLIMQTKNDVMLVVHVHIYYNLC